MYIIVITPVPNANSVKNAKPKAIYSFICIDNLNRTFRTIPKTNKVSGILKYFIKSDIILL